MALLQGSRAFLEADSVVKRYGAREALSGVSLSVSPGEVVVLLGPSGCGKSTMLRTLNGLERIDGGDIRYRGESLTAAGTDWRAIRQRIGMVFQSYDLFPHLSVIDNVTLAPIRVKKRDPEETRAAALALLERVGLADRSGSWPRELSGGQKQRVAIVRALAMDPDVLLLDEITAALDPEMVREVLDVVRDLARVGMTMVIVSHEMHFARSVADRVAFMDAGRIGEITPPEEFFARPRTERARKFLERFES
jgi:polar amino acid transport system ATP-binding protein